MQWLAGYRYLNDTELIRLTHQITPLEIELAKRLEASIESRLNLLYEFEDWKARPYWTEEEYQMVCNERDVLESDNIRLDNENVDLRIRIKELEVTHA